MRSQTEALARAALELHRVALAASEVEHLRSPATAAEKNGKGLPDPTANAAMCERREHVSAALQNAERGAVAMLGNITTVTALLASALDAWDGRR